MCVEMWRAESRMQNAESKEHKQKTESRAYLHLWHALVVFLKLVE
jgi:hypothetical protein